MKHIANPSPRTIAEEKQAERNRNTYPVLEGRRRREGRGRHRLDRSPTHVPAWPFRTSTVGWTA